MDWGRGEWLNKPEITQPKTRRAERNARKSIGVDLCFSILLL